MIDATENRGHSDALQKHEESSHRKRLEEQLAFLRRFNELLVESGGDCILVVNGEGQVVSINERGRAMLELGRAPVTGRHWVEFFQEFESRPQYLRVPDVRSTFQSSSRTPSGELKYWSITFSAFDNSPASDRFVLIARDVTEHMLAEKALRQSEEGFRKLFEENPIGIVLADLNLRITRVNNALCAMLGYSERDLIGSTLAELLYKPDPQPAEEVDRVIQGEIRSYQKETTLQTKRKQPVWVHLTTSVLREADSGPFLVFQMIENIQDRKSSEEQVLAYQEQLQSLASELSLGEERERRRMATALHDRIGQSLAFARLKLAALAQGQSEIAEVKGLIEQAIADTRSLTFELSPPVLYELGLVPALEWLARKIQQEHGVQTKFHDDGQPKPLDENFRVVLFQAVRELLVNVVKHARATHAQVLLRREADALRIIIEDDGVGFEISNVISGSEAPRTFGLFNIQERVEYLGGKVKIRSEQGRGTRVTLMAPLKVERTEQESDEQRSNINSR